MVITVQIPDDLACRMTATGEDLSRRALEALALEEFKIGHITKPELKRILNLGSRYELDDFLMAHGAEESFTLEDIALQVEGLKRLGI